jgi:hypothetical protein
MMLNNTQIQCGKESQWQWRRLRVKLGIGSLDAMTFLACAILKKKAFRFCFP